MPRMVFDFSDRCASLDANKEPLVEIDAVAPWDGSRSKARTTGAKPPTSPASQRLSQLQTSRADVRR